MHSMGMIARIVTAGAMLTLALPATGAPDAAFDAPAAFGAREAVQQMSLSPDGSHVAMISPSKGRGSVVLIADLVKGGMPKAIMRSSGNPDQLSHCKWASNTQLICQIFFVALGPDALPFTRLITINSDGSGMRQISAEPKPGALGIMQSGGAVIDWMPAAEGQVLMTRQFVPEMQTGSRVARDLEGVGVEMVDPAGTSRRIVVPPRPNAVDYISDGHGTVRMMAMGSQDQFGYDNKIINYVYRPVASDMWQPFGSLNRADGTDSGFEPDAIDRDLNIVYGFDRKDGRRALYSVELNKDLKRTLVFARPDVDVDDLIRIGRQNRVVGATFVTDRREAEFFDPELRKLRAALGKALAGKLVNFIDATADESTLLLFAFSDTDPGHHYVYHKATRQLEDVLASRPQLDGVKLATVKPITFPAADGTQIPAYLTLPPGSDGKNIPAIVMPHGGPGARDEWGFDWLSQFFANRGFAVLQPNYRGSTGYGDAWYQNNGFQSWRTAIGDVNDAGRWLKSSGIAAPDKLAIVGWSYGGYAALQSAVLDAGLFKAIVAIAPVTDLEMLRAAAQKYTNFKFVDMFIGHGPHVAQGSPARNAARIKAPVLLFHGDLDHNVGVAESRLMASRLKEAGGKVEYIEFKGLDHYLEDDVARTQMLSKSDAFLRTSLGM